MKRRQMLRGTAGLVLAAGGLASLSGCASQQIEDYAAEKPALDLARYFNGRVLAYGIFQDRAGRVVRRFNVVMDCSWNGDEGVLDPPRALFVVAVLPFLALVRCCAELLGLIITIA